RDHRDLVRALGEVVEDPVLGGLVQQDARQRDHDERDVPTVHEALGQPILLVYGGRSSNPRPAMNAPCTPSCSPSGASRSTPTERSARSRSSWVQGCVCSGPGSSASTSTGSRI